jgi:hypothetical protein
MQNWISCNFSLKFFFAIFLFFVSGRGRYTCDYTCGDFVVFDLLDLSIFWLFRRFGCRSFDCRSTLLVKSKFRSFVCRSFVCRSFVCRPIAVVPKYYVSICDKIQLHLTSLYLHAINCLLHNPIFT